MARECRSRVTVHPALADRPFGIWRLTGADAPPSRFDDDQIHLHGYAQVYHLLWTTRGMPPSTADDNEVWQLAAVLGFHEPAADEPAGNVSSLDAHRARRHGQEDDGSTFLTRMQAWKRGEDDPYVGVVDPGPAVRFQPGGGG